MPDRAQLIAGERHRYNSKHVNANFVKFHFDGTPVSRSAYFLEPYRGTDAHYGILNETPEELRSLMVQLDRQHIAANIHVVGDAAARLAMDAIEHARKVNGPNGPRHMLAHTLFLDDDDVKRVAELNIAAEFTYYPMLPEVKDFVDYQLDELINEAARPRWMNLKPVLESGGRAVFGSDLVCIPEPDVFPALAAFLEREVPARSITVEDALLMLTLNGAWAMNREDEAGSIRVGKYADFVVLDRDWFDIPASEVAGTKVVQTVFEGRVVYSW